MQKRTVRKDKHSIFIVYSGRIYRPIKSKLVSSDSNTNISDKTRLSDQQTVCVKCRNDSELLVIYDCPVLLFSPPLSFFVWHGNVIGNYDIKKGLTTERYFPVNTNTHYSRLPNTPITFNPSNPIHINSLLDQFGPEGVYEIARTLMRATEKDIENALTE